MPYRHIPFRHRLKYIIPAIRLVNRRENAHGDPWVCVDVPGLQAVFGSGSTWEFSWYFEGSSNVDVKSIEDICSFLLDCEYVSDADLFMLPDVWQHPSTFETAQKGDCEDHALWAWRKLQNLSIHARLIVGRQVGSEHGHAWITFEAGSDTFIFEATAKSRDHMVAPFLDAQSRYCPYFSVDHSYRVAMYGGFLDRIAEERNLRRRKCKEKRTA